MRDDAQRLNDILEAIGSIRRRLPSSRESFLRDELVQVWILHHLQIIGEAARALGVATKDLAPQIPWAQIVGLRNVVVHQYFGVDFELVYATANRLTELEDSVRRLLDSR